MWVTMQLWEIVGNWSDQGKPLPTPKSLTTFSHARPIMGPSQWWEPWNSQWQCLGHHHLAIWGLPKNMSCELWNAKCICTIVVMFWYLKHPDFIYHISTWKYVHMIHEFTESVSFLCVFTLWFIRSIWCIYKYDKPIWEFNAIYPTGFRKYSPSRSEFLSGQ